MRVDFLKTLPSLWIIITFDFDTPPPPPKKKKESPYAWEVSREKVTCFILIIAHLLREVGR